MVVTKDDPRIQRVGFCKLSGEGVKFYANKYVIVIGRRSKSTQIDVVLGDNMNISRQHAMIAYNFDKGVWELKVLGKNGVTVKGILHTPASPPLALLSGDLLQFGDRSFFFLLAKGSRGRHSQLSRRGRADGVAGGGISKPERPHQPSPGAAQLLAVQQAGNAAVTASSAPLSHPMTTPVTNSSATFSQPMPTSGAVFTIPQSAASLGPQGNPTIVFRQASGGGIALPGLSSGTSGASQGVPSMGASPSQPPAPTMSAASIQAMLAAQAQHPQGQGGTIPGAYFANPNVSASLLQGLVRPQATAPGISAPVLGAPQQQPPAHLVHAPLQSYQRPQYVTSGQHTAPARPAAASLASQHSGASLASHQSGAANLAPQHSGAASVAPQYSGAASLVPQHSGAALIQGYGGLQQLASGAFSSPSRPTQAYSQPPQANYSQVPPTLQNHMSQAIQNQAPQTARQPSAPGVAEMVQGALMNQEAAARLQVPAGFPISLLQTLQFAQNQQLLQQQQQQQQPAQIQSVPGAVPPQPPASGGAVQPGYWGNLNGTGPPPQQ